MASRALIIEDEHTARRRLAAMLGGLGLSVLEADSVDSGRQHLEDGIAMLFLDLGLPGVSGGEFLREVVSRHPDVPVVIVHREGRAERCIEMMRLGAYDHLVEPVQEGALEAVVRRAEGAAHLRREVRRLRAERDRREGLKSVVGSSSPMRKVYEQVRQAAPSRTSVTFLGESGTGKELLARALHHESPRRHGPFVALRCSAVPPEMLESMLFGHRAGVTPRAPDDHRGHLLLADGGTLFLDHVGEMGPELQAKLLRVLHEGTMRPQGAAQALDVDVRVVAATSRDLDEQLAAGRFREDLYYRLVAFPIHVPALRQRPEDIPELAYHFLHKHREDTGRPEVTRIDDHALLFLKRHPWPGNVQQLENAIHHALLRTGPGGVLTVAALPESLRDPESAAAPATHAGNGRPASNGASHGPSPFHDPETGRLLPLREIEERAFRLALAEHGGNTTQAAKALGVARATFYRRLKSKRSA